MDRMSIDAAMEVIARLENDGYAMNPCHIEMIATAIGLVYNEPMAQLDRLKRAEHRQYYRSLYDGRDSNERLD